MIGTVIAMASLTVAVVGALLTLALKLSSSQGEAKDLAARLASATEGAKAKDASIADLAKKLETANARVEALDAENQKLRAGQPVAGSFDRLRAEAAAQAANRGHGAGGVSDDKASTAPGPDDLLDPAKA